MRSIEALLMDPLLQHEAIKRVRDHALADFFYFTTEVMSMGEGETDPCHFTDPAYGPAFEAHEKWLVMDGLGLMPRGTGKSTLWTQLRSLWLGLRNPNIRIAVASAKYENAKDMVQVIRRWMLFHPGLREVFGPFGDLPTDKNWGKAGILRFPKRTLNTMEETIEALGADQQITSRHYDLICCKPGTEVRTTRGLVPIEEIRPKEMVLSHDGRRHRVRKTFTSEFDGELVGITAQKSSCPIWVTPNHPVLVRRIEGGLPVVKFVPAAEVTKNDYLPFPRVEHDNPRMVKRKDDGFNALLKSHAFYRFLGYWYAEGSVESEGNRVRLTFGDSPEERVFVEECKQVIRESLGPVNIGEELGPSVVRLSFFDKRLPPILRKCGRLQPERFLPFWIKQAEFPKIAQFLRAYWNGDGSRVVQANADAFVQFGSSSRSLLADIQQVLLDRGISTSLRKCAEAGEVEILGNACERGAAWSLVGGDDLAEFLGLDDKRRDKMFKPNRYFFDDCFVYHRVRLIERTPYKGPVYNLNVEGSNTYCHELITSHNCGDDLVNRETINTAEQIANTEKWWGLTKGLLVTGGIRILIGTRWHFHDLYGTTVAKEDEREAKGADSRVHICRVPARKERSDGSYDQECPPRFRHKGEKKLQEDLEDLGATSYAGQIDLDPLPEGQALFKESDFRRAFYERSTVFRVDPETKKSVVRPGFEVAITCDLAASLDPSADRSAIIVSATDPDGDIYILDAVAGRMPPSQVIAYLARLRNRYDANWIGTEKGVLKAIYKSALLEWTRDNPHQRPLFFTEINTRERSSKYERALSIEPYAQAGKIHLLATQTELLQEIVTFPLGRYKDYVDALAFRCLNPRRPRGSGRKKPKRAETVMEKCHSMVMKANREYEFSND